MLTTCAAKCKKRSSAHRSACVGDKRERERASDNERTVLELKEINSKKVIF